MYTGVMDIEQLASELLAQPQVGLNELAMLMSKVPPYPYAYHRLTVELTQYCPVGCEHCKYATPLPLPGNELLPTLYLSAHAIQSCLDFTWRQRVPLLFISGGGEPTLHWDYVFALTSQAYCHEIVLATAGQWAQHDQETDQFIAQIRQSLAKRARPATFVLRLSVDDFHQKNVDIHNIARIIHRVKDFQHEDSQIRVEIRSLLSEDEAVAELAACLGVELQLVDADHEILRWPDGYQVNVIRKVLLFDGKFRNKQEHVDLKFVCFDTGRAVSNKTYGSKWPSIYKDGINLGIRPSGRLYIYGANPASFGTIYQKSIEAITDELCRDLINRACLDGKHIHVWEIAQHFDPAVRQVPDRYNGLSLLVPKSVEKFSTRLYTSLALLVEEIDAGTVPVEVLQTSPFFTSILMDGNLLDHLRKLILAMAGNGHHRSYRNS
jgi:MoaA/NifB/PqqE/SkfB family radical SAM enzyme